jgi:hypothetical protein
VGVWTLSLALDATTRACFLASDDRRLSCVLGLAVVAYAFDRHQRVGQRPYLFFFVVGSFASVVFVVFGFLESHLCAQVAAEMYQVCRPIWEKGPGHNRDGQSKCSQFIKFEASAGEKQCLGNYYYR